jgi:hypothetical protein
MGMVMKQSALLDPHSIDRDRTTTYPDLNWQQFKLIQAGFAPSRGIRLFYSHNTLEILMPGRNYEVFSRLIGFLIGLYCLENQIEFEPTGSMTQESEIPELVNLDIELLTRCVLMAQTSRLEAASKFWRSFKLGHP